MLLEALLQKRLQGMGIKTSERAVHIGLGIFQHHEQGGDAERACETHEQKFIDQKLDGRGDEPDSHPDKHGELTARISPPPEPDDAPHGQAHHRNGEGIGGDDTRTVCINDIPVLKIMNGKGVNDDGGKSREHQQAMYDLPVILNLVEVREHTSEAGETHADKAPRITFADKTQEPVWEKLPVCNHDDRETVSREADERHKPDAEKYFLGV